MYPHSSRLSLVERNELLALLPKVETRFSVTAHNEMQLSSISNVVNVSTRNYPLINKCIQSLVPKNEIGN